MFTKSKDEITFEDVKTFCKGWSEGVRVEYKRQIEVKKHIPKIVSSFANTLGGIFLIGVETDKTKNEVIFPIQGTPKKPGIEEQIQQSALTGIYPAVIPDVKIVDVPKNGNIVIVVRIDESVQAPHAIQNSTRIYIRTGSITQPYELAQIDRIEYMLKRREDSQAFTQQILNRIEDRTKRVGCTQDVPSITVIVRPVFPYRPVISTSDIYNLPEWSNWSPRQRVTSGVYYLSGVYKYYELNEYGIVYHKASLSCSDAQEIEYGEFVRGITLLIEFAAELYKQCEYLGNIEIEVVLQQVFGIKLRDNSSGLKWDKITDNIPGGANCSDSEIFVSKQCFPRDLYDLKARKKFIENLMIQLLWSFNIPNDDSRIKERVRERIQV